MLIVVMMGKWSDDSACCIFHDIRLSGEYVCCSVVFGTLVGVFNVMCSVAMNLTIWYVVLVYHQYDVCKNYVVSLYVGGYGGLSESGPCVFRELCPVGFLLVG